MLMLLLLSTIYDLVMRKRFQRKLHFLQSLIKLISIVEQISFVGNKKNIFCVFSIFSNGEGVFGRKQEEDNDGYVSSLDGIRAITILWLSFGQRNYAYVHFPIMNRLQFREVNKNSFKITFYLDIK